MNRSRRDFLKAGALSVSAALIWPKLNGASQTSQPEPEGYNTVGKRHGRWWLIKPDGGHTFSLGVNHIDPATLRYPENLQQPRPGTHPWKGLPHPGTRHHGPNHRGRE